MRPRYGRIAAFLAATSTTLVSLVGTLVVDQAGAPAAGSAVTLSSGPTAGSVGEPSAAASAALATAPLTALRAALSVGLASLSTTAPPAEASPADEPADEGADDPTEDPADRPADQAADDRADDAAGPVVPAPPEGSGTGRRVVFSESQQRVWLVDAAEDVVRTYLVSGSKVDNLDPGSYEVYSRSRTATGIDGSDLRLMVRFTVGDTAPIGFHSIPRMDGRRMQTRAELGTPLSHGCVRQALPDARALWRFAPVGTVVVVTA